MNQTKINVKLVKGDHRSKYKLPMPLCGKNDKVLGELVAVDFDGEHTTGEIELNELGEQVIDESLNSRLL